MWWVYQVFDIIFGLFGESIWNGARHVQCAYSTLDSLRIRVTLAYCPLVFNHPPIQKLPPQPIAHISNFDLVPPPPHIGRPTHSLLQNASLPFDAGSQTAETPKFYSFSAFVQCFPRSQYPNPFIRNFPSYLHLYQQGDPSSTFLLPMPIFSSSPYDRSEYLLLWHPFFPFKRQPTSYFGARRPSSGSN